jgi:hypothetical protein
MMRAMTHHDVPLSSVDLGARVDVTNVGDVLDLLDEH